MKAAGTAASIVLGMGLDAQVLAGAPGPTVATLGASAKGTTGMTVNGAIHPRGLPTTYVFEFGPTADYGQRTPVQELPPRAESVRARLRRRSCVVDRAPMEQPRQQSDH